MSYPLEHVRFGFEVTTLTDMHVGDGGVGKLEELRHGATRRRPDGQPVNVATVARDHAGHPTIPATGLKGALRKALAPVMARNEIETLFGTIREQDEAAPAGYGGGMGRFSFYAAQLQLKGGPPGTQLPFWDKDARTWIATHVAISERTGTADPQKLFNLEMVPAETTFDVSGVFFGSVADARQHLARVLAPLARPGGLAVGSGSKLGRGAVRLAGDVLLTVTRFDPAAGAVVGPATEALAIAPAPAPGDLRKLMLACDGPFASVDPDAPPEQPGDNTNTIPALRRHTDVPVIYPDTVMGALRARAAWLGAVRWNDATDGGKGGDDRFRKPTWSSPDELSPVQRLFGVAGWRGLLRIARIGSIGGARRCDLTGIALDRFSGAVLDGTIFVHCAFSGVTFELDLALDTRAFDKKRTYPDADDEELLKLLIKDIIDNGLLLGHATNRGFGWFAVAKR